MTLGCSTTRSEGSKSRTWRDEIGRCWHMAAFDCPPPQVATCNPPPPMRVECPTDLATLESDHWTARVGRMESGTCVETVAPSCPPTVETCQERAPREVPCPEDAKLLAFDRFVKKAPAPRPWRDEEGECWVMPRIDCPPPEVATCNPPPPQKVECPADPKELSSDRFKPTR